MTGGGRAWIVVIVFVTTAMWLVSCREISSSQRVAADALTRAADACLIDVRDRDLAWERSTNCASLSSLADSYIALGGFQSEPAEVRVIAEQARATAWMARTVSLPGGKGLSIW
jgi:hypothetical protein